MKRLVLVCVLAVGPAAAAQTPAPCVSTQATHAPAFLECARAATEKYQDRQIAIRDGYRLIGRDFPAMGEHWIRIGLVFDGRLDPARPEVLNYVIVDGRATLAGLGYAVPLLPGEQAPEAPAGRGAWHDHFRSIEQETAQEHVHQHGTPDVPRLAMLHAWVWSPNPDGVFAAENWALAFVRLGLPVPAVVSSSAAKALSLVTGGVEYFEGQLSPGAAGAAGRAALRGALLRARARAEAIVAGREGPGLSPADLAALAAVWDAVAPPT
jgi:hypothetical protein